MKSKYILIMALIMALVTSILFSQYLNNLEKKYQKKENKVKVVVANQNISKNQKITREMLQIKSLSQDAVYPQAVKRIEDIEGKYALTDIKSGEMLFADRFTDQYKETEVLTRKIREGCRAISVEVNYVESVSNLIQPEEYVDVVFSEKVKQTGVADTVNTSIILQNVRVLAVGNRISEKSTNVQTAKSSSTDGKNTSASASTGTSTQYVSVTLELKPEDAIKLENADERGNIKLILRSEIFPQQ